MAVNFSRGFIPFLLLFFILFSCAKKELTEEDRIKAEVEKAVEYIRTKNLDGLTGLLSKDYKDEKGRDYGAVKKMLAEKLSGYLSITVMARNIDIKLEDSDATMVVDMVFIKNMEVEDLEEVPPEAVTGYRFTVRLKKEDTGWKVASASWYDAGLATLL